ncbi:ABC transporter ATP-binding protein/permease [Jeotgalibaca sp. MA1X17-3]|uniref:ABC transporter ATP-binding protein n=1 Tax=Jeotgalibaca sp. MA1X17-3 TaxID=2908211 RepID=UPI001F3962F3|nr:ABC transporter ATP-binding protein [Jeotgalibaca sp. MA1X17-3]UJF16537.1 ABC transporter ATP-binding protein/permease [Jeotgalibaca sp. MA1X17-3]
MIQLGKRISWKAFLGSVLFIIIQVFAELNLPNMTSNIINEGIAKGNIEYIWRTGFIMLLLTLVTITAAIISVYISAREAQRIGREVRGDVYRKIINLSKDKIDTVGTASLITRTTNDVEQIQMVVMMFLRLMMFAPIMGIGAAVLSYSKSPSLSRVFLISIPVLITLLSVVMFSAIPLFKKIQKKTDKLNLIFREGLTGVRVIRAFNKSTYEEERFSEANESFKKNNIKAFSIVSLLSPLMTLVLSGTNIAIIWMGGQFISVGNLSVGDLVAFINYSFMLLFSFLMTTMILTMIPRAQVSANRINDVLAMESTIQDGKISFSDTQSKKLRSELEFKKVSYRFLGAELDTVKDINFDVRAGQTLAIIGGTGSGKTTIANLIMRFYDPTEGAVLLNDVNLTDLEQYSIRESIGYVPQKANLFSGTIRENIQFGKKNATDKEIWKALDTAQAKDFVSKMEDGLDSRVEQGGSNFSGGQKQRLCIARAIIKNPEIYLFDDSFSALDYKTDAALRKQLKSETDDAIVVIIAQRVSTIMDADVIVVLDNGNVVGKGTHEELKNSNVTYQEILESQFKEGEGE